MKTDVESIVALARKLHFEVSDEVRADFTRFFEAHLDALSALQAIDTSGVKPLAYIDATPKITFREDIIGAPLPLTEVLSNAKVVINHQVAIPRLESNND